MRAPFSVTLTLSLQRVIDGWRLSFFMNRWHPAAENDRLPTMWATYHTAVPAKALKTRWRSGLGIPKPQTYQTCKKCWSFEKYPHFEFDAYLTCLARSWWFEEGVDRNSGPGSPMDHARHFPTECVPSPRWAGLWFQRVSTLFQPFWAFIFFMIFMYFSYIS